MQIDLPDPTPAILSAMTLQETSDNLCDVLTMTAISDDQKFTADAITTTIKAQSALISVLLSEYVEMVEVLGDLARKIPE